MSSFADYKDAFFQCYFIPAPTLTEHNLPSQAGRVFIVTGGYAGCGKELSKILYGKNGTVYLAGRSQDKAEAATEEMKKAHPNSDGRVEFLKVDLADLTSIKPAVEEFLKKEQRLDVLTNNAGVMIPPDGSRATQGHELQMGTNCVGPYLLTKLLTPLLVKTAASSPPGSVRVTWAGSLATVGSPKNGVIMEENGPKIHAQNGTNYAQSKGANVLLARAYQSHQTSSGIISNAWNPGNLSSELQRHTPWIGKMMLKLLLYPPIYGAYTELYAGWAEEAGKEEMKGEYYGPWGRKVRLREDLRESKEMGRFWAWCERETEGFA